MTQLKQHDRTEAALHFMEQQDKLPAIPQRRSIRVLKKTGTIAWKSCVLVTKGAWIVTKYTGRAIKYINQRNSSSIRITIIERW